MTLLVVVLAAWSVLGFAAGWWMGWRAGLDEGHWRGSMSAHRRPLREGPGGGGSLRDPGGALW